MTLSYYENKGITLRNFKSFGNQEQKISLNDDGNLILLVGKNGNGKTSVMESIDYTLFNEVKGKAKKKQVLSSLPNRINGELLTSVDFISDNGEEVIVKRGQGPKKLELWINGIDDDRAGNSNIDAKIESLVGMDYETYKSFISMSINDFKNFISLKPDEKRLLLDKLFNLQILNELNDILKSLAKNNNEESDRLTYDIRIIEQSIEKIKESIKKTEESKKQDISKQIEELKNFLTTNKEIYNGIQEKLKGVSETKNKLETEIEDERKSFAEIKSNISELDRKIALYESGKCPTCESDLTTTLSLQVKETYHKQKETLSAMFETVRTKGLEMKENLDKVKTSYDKINSEMLSLKYELQSKKTEYDKLNAMLKAEDNTELLSDNTEFIKNIEEFEKTKEEKKDELSQKNSKKILHKELQKIFSEDGVKKSIIENIVIPINKFIEENITGINFPFEVYLDENFSATILQNGVEIDPESLSTGETRKVNLAIMIAYLKIIRTKKNINVLFLDEVFSSIDVESIEDILKLFKKFARDYNINIFLVHHSNLDSNHFDRILMIKKEFFSYIEEVV